MHKNHSARGVDCERNFLRALLELYQDMPLLIPNNESNDMENYRRLDEVRRHYNKESNDMESYLRLEEVRRYSNKELKVSRESIEAVRGQKDYATLGS